jgi:AraC family transcriptional regulator of adaptative response/methylated-DNA-[protein]-cysteine methyltransferase
MPDWLAIAISGTGMNVVQGDLTSVGRPEVSCEAVVPGVRPAAELLMVGRITTPFGRCLMASAGGALCFLEFVTDDEQPAMTRLRTLWPDVRLLPATGPGRPLWPLPGGAVTDPPRLHLRGTSFQLRVWNALLGIPAGTRLAYSELASRIGLPHAVRAVAGAVAANHLAVLVPCHRIVRADGDPGGYRWGRSLKLALLAAEQAATHLTVIHGAASQQPGE